MEPNVDRGMWAIVALLIAVVIGGAIMLLFPGFVGQIGERFTGLLSMDAKGIIEQSGVEKGDLNLTPGGNLNPKH